MRKEASFDAKFPLLYVIATPIGNLDEFSQRAKNVISEMDYIACEDTRVSGKLLSLFGFKKQLISCHEHNEIETSNKIIDLIQKGSKIAYMSDAGYPCVSDPGQRLIALAIENNIHVSVVSGSNAMLNALVGSGLETDHFYFQGFLEAKESVKKEQLLSLFQRKETLIFYESPHRITSTLKLMDEVLGNRKACIARELTKLHEEYIRGTLDEFLTLKEDELKGEMVIIIEGNKENNIVSLDNNEIKGMVNNFVNLGMSTKDAIKKVSEVTKVNKNQIYKIYHS